MVFLKEFFKKVNFEKNQQTIVGKELTQLVDYSIKFNEIWFLDCSVYRLGNSARLVLRLLIIFKIDLFREFQEYHQCQIVNC